MMFHEKLDFLMRLTNTSNSILAKYTSLDPSFISRLRSGSRKPSKNENYITLISEVLARRCNEEYQNQGFLNQLRAEDNPLLTSENPQHIVISKWLRSQFDDVQKKDDIGNFIRELDDFSFRKSSKGTNETHPYSKPLPKKEVYYGIEGKRAAVLQFMRDIIESDSLITLHLYSDEDLAWLVDDPVYTQEWARLFTQVLMKGNKVKIIHTISRSLDEMFTAIREWMPFYLTGNIEPYYYPRSRDRNFRRTMFIAPQLCAVSSSSMSRSTENSINFYLTDRAVLDALYGEFQDFLRLCRPLMKIFNQKATNTLRSTLAEFEAEKADSILRSATVASITLPLFSLEKFAKDFPKELRDQLLDFHRSRHMAFQKMLEGNKFTEIIRLPDPSDIINKKVPIGFTAFIGKPLYYDLFSFKSQLENMLSLMKHYPNYTVIVAEEIQDELTIYAKENIGLVIMKYTSPSISFAINEPYMTLAFWDYLKTSTPYSSKDIQGRSRSIETIEQYLKKLKDF